MKTRRLLALVLCFVMLFSDATSTLASTNSGEPIVITDSSELEELLNVEVIETDVADTEVLPTEVPETDVTSTEETSEEAVSTETTEVVVPEGTEIPAEEPEATTEVVEPTEVVEEDTEEIIIEEAENIKAANTSIMVGYSDGENWVNIGTTPYTSIADAVAAIKAYIADNPGFNKTVSMDLQADAELTGDLDLGTLDVQLRIGLNGHNLIVLNDAVIRADVCSTMENFGTVEVAAGKNLSILPFDPCGEGMSYDETWEIEQNQTDVEYTNWQHVNINFNSAEPGNLIIGQSVYEGGSTKAHIRLNDVYINNAKNVTIEGNVGIGGINVDPSAIQFSVAETITVNNKGDNHYENHYVELLVSTNCNNLVWYTDGTIGDLIVNDTMTVDTESNLTIWGQFTVNNIHVEALDDPWGCFGVATRHLYKADGTLESAGTITINGQLTADEGLKTPVNFRKEKWAYDSATAEWPNHIGMLAYEEGEVIATAPNVNRQLVSLNNEGSDRWLFAAKNEQGQLVVQKTAVEVIHWNDETNDFAIQIYYSSLEEAVSGMYTEFGEAAGQYIIHLYDDIKLNEDVTLPDFANYVRVEANRRTIDVFHENGEHDYSFDETTFVNVDFNGHTISVNGNVEWSEAISMTNSAEAEAQLYIRGNEECGFRVQSLYTDSELEQVYINAAGEEVTWPVAEYAFNTGVDINIPNGFFDVGVHESDTTTRIIDAEVIVNGIRIHNGTWKITDLTVFGRETGSHFNTGADLTVTGTFIATGGSFIEVRGKLLLGDIVLKPHQEDPYANLHFQIVKTFGPENPEVLTTSGQLIFTGGLVVEEGFEGIPLSIDKKHVIRTYMFDENGEIMYEDEAKRNPCINEEDIWDNMVYETGEVLATITESSTLNASMFMINGGSALAIVGDGSLKVGKAAVRVNLYIPEEDRGFECGYESLEDAIAKMASDFGGREGHYTITLLENTILTQDIVVPDFVRNMNWQTKREWIEHLDENGEPIRIYDEAGNEIGIEGHDRITALKLEMNGHSITANCDMEWSEMLQIINDSDKASEIYIKAEANPGPEGYWPSFRTAWLDENAELVYSDNSPFTFGAEHTWIDNVTLRVPNGRVEFDTWDDGTHIINGELIVSSFKAHNGSWIVADVTIVGATDGSFIGENAKAFITGKTTWLGGAGVEVRGELTLYEFFMNTNEEDPYANMWIEIAEVYDRDKEGTDEYFISKGKLTFAGALETAESFKAGKAVHIDKKQIFYYQARDEHGNLLFHDEAKTDPMIWEDQWGGLGFESDETAAYVTDSRVNANQFSTNGSGISFEIVGQELKAYKAAIYVDLYIEEEDRGIGFSYKTLEEAFANLERDFEGRAGSYTFNILKDVELAEDIVLPDFVKNLRLQSEWMWREHYNEETGEPIWIYDEQGNQVGIEGHHDVYVATLDLNGHSITSAGHFEVMEGLHVISDAANKGALISTSENGGVSLRQIDNGGLIEENGTSIEVTIDNPFVILDNVDVTAEKAQVELWSQWGAYTVNGDITARFMNVRGSWIVGNVKITNDLCIESGWYDEENDCGEPDGYLTADNVSIYNGHMHNGGRLVVKDTFTAKNSTIENYAILIADKLLVPSGEFHNWEQVSVKDAQIEWFYNHTDIMFFEDNPETPEVNEEHMEEWGALFIADTFTQSGDASSFMDGSSTLVVNKKAVLNNLCVGAWNPDAQNAPSIVRMPGAELEINEDIYPGTNEMPLDIGIIKKPNDSVVGMGMVEVFDKDSQTGTIYGSWFETVFVNANGDKAAEIGEYGWPMKTFAKDDVLFTTDIKNVRLDLIALFQHVEEGKEDEVIWETSQDGNKVVVGGYTIFVHSVSNGDWKWLKDFKDWSEAVEYIDSLANPNLVYVIEVTEDINLDGTLPLPKNAAEVVIHGLSEKQVGLKFKGDLSLTSNLVLGNINLDVPSSTIKLNDCVMILEGGSTASIGSVTGPNGGILVVTGNSVLMVRKAVTGLDGLEAMYGAVVELGIDNTVDASTVETLQMYGSKVVLYDKFTVENVVSWNDINEIIVNGADCFTITDTVYGPEARDENLGQFAGEIEVGKDNTFAITEANPAKAKIRAAAINLVNFNRNTNFVEGDVLVTAPNVSASWFVTGSVYSKQIVDEETGDFIWVRTGIGSLTHKDGDTICYGEGDTTEKVVELKIFDDAAGDFITHESYKTLNDAFIAIEGLNNSEGMYRIMLKGDVEIGSLTTPSKARFVQIWSEGNPKTITYGGDIKLNTNFLIANAILKPETGTSAISMDKYGLSLVEGVKMADDCKITSVTGSGIGKGSIFELYDVSLEVFGDVKNVDEVYISGAELIVNGAVNVGDIYAGGAENQKYQPTLVGSAVVTRNADNKITKVDSQITITGEVNWQGEQLTIALREKGTENYINFLDAEESLWTNGIWLAKAPKTPSMMVLLSANNIKDAAQYAKYTSAKANGYLVCQKNDNIGLSVEYIETYYEDVYNEADGEWTTEEREAYIWSYCKTFADAVTEIDALKTKQVYYIFLLPAMSDISAKEPAALKMPNAKYVELLYIATGGSGYAGSAYTADLHYTGNITFTSDTMVEGVDFVQVAKNAAGQYVSVNELKDGYPEAVTISTGGNSLIVAQVSFNTPIKLDGKKKGNLGIFGSVVTYTNENSIRANGSIFGDMNQDGIADLSRVCGSITNFNEVAILSDFILDEYKSGSKYVAPTLSTTSLAVEDVFFDLNSYDIKAKATIKNLYAFNGELYVEGTASFDYAQLNGAAWVGAIDTLKVKNVELYDSPMMLGGKFEITGNVWSNTSDAVFASIQKSATDKTPGLNIKGKVELADPANQIGVVVYGYDANGDFGIVDLSGAPNTSAMLLTAKNATADMFKAGAVKTNVGVLDNLVDAKVNQYGYALLKSGSNIYVYYGDEIKVELSKDNQVLGYYNNIAEATKAIDALKDSDASYTLTLLNEYGSVAAPAELKMPKQASTVAIQKTNGKMYFNGKVSLGASTALVVASEAEFAGDVTGKGTFALGRNMTITVNGKVDVANLALNGGSILDAKGVVTIGTIANNGNGQKQNAIIYGKDAKDITYLTIKGWVDGNNANPVLLQLKSDTDKASYALDSENGKVILENTQKIANIEKAALSSFEVSINNEKFTTLAQVVKANKGVYHVDIDTDADWLGTWLEFTKDGKTYTTYCLDFAQAVNEINTLADKNTDYIINICRKNTTIWDVNLTDTKSVSAITMPKANVANSVTIAYSGAFDWQRGMEFTGNISYAGNLGFVNCEIEAANISNVKTLTLDNTAFVTTGTVKADNVVIKGNTTWDAFGKTTVGGLDAAEKGSSSYIASKPDAKGVPTFVVNGEVPAVTAWKVIKANATADTAAANRYVDTYKDVSLVVAKAAGADRFMAYPFVDADAGNNEGITNLVAYKDTKNAVKNGNGDDMKVLLSYEGGSTYVKSYDEAVKLIDAIGDKNGFYTIQFLTSGEVTTTGVAGSYGKLTLPKKAAYVEICGHAVTNGKADTTLKYTGTMKTSVGLNLRDIELTEGTAKGDVFTPSYAVTPVTSGKNTEINFFGAVSTMKKDNTQTADLAFTSVGGNGNIVIIDRDVEVAGSVAANVFVMNNGGTVSVEKDVKVTELVIAENATIEAKGKFTAKIVRVLDNVKEEYLSAVIDADGTIAITDIYGNGYSDRLRIVTNRTAGKNESQLTVSGQTNQITVEVAMNKYDATLDAYRAMNMEEVTAMFVSEEGAVPTKEQMLMTAPKASSMFVYAAAYVENAEEQYAGWETVYEVYDQYADAYSTVSAYVHDGGVYLTDLVPLMVVAGGTEENGPFYTSYFMDWTQAVNQIDKKLNNKNALYEMVVLRSVGRKLDGTLEPIKNPALPTKADRVYVISGMGDNAGVFFTGSKLTAKTNTEIWATNFVAVKEMEEDGETWYESVAYDMNIGNYAVRLDNIRGWADGYESKLGTISGSKKGHLTFSRSRDAEVNETVASMIKGIGTVEFTEFNDNDENEPWQASYYVPKGISGVQNLILQPYTFVGAFEGDISVKDVYANIADMYAKNITVSGTIEMSYTGLSAGTETVGDGAIKLKNVVLNGKCGIYGSQDKNGKSLIQITGNISTGAEFEGDTEGLLQIGLFYNNDSGWVPLSNKLVLLTAPKADASWFVPNYSREEYEQAVDEETGEPLFDEDGNPIFVQVVDEETGEPLFDEEGNPIYVVHVQDAMGWEREGYGTYKQGKVIYYGKLGE
ncbi:MAG: hypothetical protein IKL06_02150 [Lachnospiraceae bacterium]|nr:hypothetical protein [Lachnospiraceae bacterium]